MSKEQDLAAIEEVYQKWCTAWRNLDTKLQVSLFDKEDSMIAYQSEENRGPCFSHDQIAKYWSVATTVLAGVERWEPVAENMKKVSYGGDFAMIYVVMNTILRIQGGAEPFPGELRASIGLRKKDGEWKIYHYHESRQLEFARKANIGLDDKIGIQMPKERIDL